MVSSSRREFLGGLGRGMLLVGVGPGLLPAGLERWLDDEPLEFGDLEPLVDLIQETPPQLAGSVFAERLRGGLRPRFLAGAAALANARVFGGEHYDGYHAFMALAPALEMGELLPRELAALPLLKVLHRNARFFAAVGAPQHETLHRLDVEDDPRQSGLTVREAVRARDLRAAERRFAAVARRAPEEVFGELQAVVQDDVDVHRIVLAWRAWDMLAMAGRKHAHTLLRQSVRHCVDAEGRRRDGAGLRELLPELLEKHGLAAGPKGAERPSDEALVELSETIFAAGPEAAAAAMAAALASGHDPDALGESLSLAANKLLLNDPGRSSAEEGKPSGSVHGASVGVHACDAARAWRNVARVVGGAHGVAGLIAGAYHTGGQSGRVRAEEFPWRERDEAGRGLNPAKLLEALGEAFEARDQQLACSLADRFGRMGGSSQHLLELCLEHAVRADGALHAEKFFSTMLQELKEARPAFRLRHTLALARVTASQSGFPAPGVAEARELLTR